MRQPRCAGYLVAALLGAGSLAIPVGAQIPEQYPKPLIHTATNHPAAHVLLVSVDGLHAFDLAGYVATHPQSTLARLTARGVTYTNVHAPWADPAAGLASLITGGTPISTGIVTADGFDRHPSRPGIRVNTIFEVVHQKVGPTAWAAESDAALDLARGPSQQGLDDARVAPSDQRRFDAVLRWIDGKKADTDAANPIPALFGFSYGGIAAQQRADGYLDLAGTPTKALLVALDQLDSTLATLVARLQSAGLYDSTWIVVTAPYGEAPVDRGQRQSVPFAALQAALQPLSPVHLGGGDVALIWLADPTTTPIAIARLNARAAALGIADILAGPRLAATFNPASTDSRAPDIVLVPRRGVVYGTSAIARGGVSDFDTHVAMLIAGSQLTGRSDPTWVPTTQLAPLLLRALGLEKFDLEALHHEHSPALPGIF